MVHYADLGTETEVASAPWVRAVGWLGAGDDYPRGDVSRDCLERIQRFAALWTSSTVELRWPVGVRPRTCALCGQPIAAGTFAVPGRDVLYVCPEMLPHFVVEHGYAPPHEFQAAIMASPLPSSVEYEQLVKPYRAAVRDPWD